MKKTLLPLFLSILVSPLFSQGANSCIDSSKICSACVCPLYVLPVCGCDGKTYINSCYAINAGVLYWTMGSCSPVNNCTANFSYVIDSVGTGVYFANQSSGNYTSSEWSFGDGDTSTSNDSVVYHQYAAKGLYTICLNISSADSSCRDSICQQLAISTSGLCMDSSVFDTGIACSANYNPVCGCNGVTYNNPCEAYYHNGVTSWTQGACPVSPPCQAYFNYWLDATGYGVYFGFSSAGVINQPGYSENLFWNFGDGDTSTSQFPYHQYSDTSIHSYYVCLTVKDSAANCTSQFCDSVYVGLTPKGCNVSFVFSIDSTGGVVVTPDTSNGVTYTAWVWDVNNGVIIDSLNPHLPVDSSSNLSVCFVVTDSSISCTDTVCLSSAEIYASGIAAGIKTIPTTAQLYLYPNPAGNSTQLSLVTLQNTTADITLKNLLGETVCQIASGSLDAGRHFYSLNLEKLSSGVYLVEVRLDNLQATVKKLVKQ